MSVVMIRPDYFAVNPETARDNRFQSSAGEGDVDRAVAEFDAMKAALQEAGIRVLSFGQKRRDTPDAVFPNNWFSTHHSGLIVQYPMFAQSRRLERRQDIFRALGQFHKVTGVMDLSPNEDHGQFLEGTGAIVFDHEARIALMAKSQRADERLLAYLCDTLDYTAHTFTAVDAGGVPIYHTNVMMSVGRKTALIGFETVPDPDEVLLLRRRIEDGPDRTIVELTAGQVASFAGNALEIEGDRGPVLVISRRGWDALRPDQQDELERAVHVITPNLPTIEKSGGSARCMMAGVHLPPRS